MGLMMLVVKAVIRPLKAKAMTSPTATTITSPRMRKFLKPFMPFPPIRDHERPPGWQVRCLTFGCPVARSPLVARTKQSPGEAPRAEEPCLVLSPDRDPSWFGAPWVWCPSGARRQDKPYDPGDHD